MFSELFALYSTNMPRAAAITAVEFLVMISILWVSWYDIERKSVTFWKMFITGLIILGGTLAVSLFYNCKVLGGMKHYLWVSIPLWFLLLYVNIKFNHEKFIGKADVDLVTAVFALGVCFSAWALNTMEDSNLAVITVTTFWYRLLGYLLVGCLLFLLCLCIFAFIKSRKNGTTVTKTLLGTKVSMLPMFIPLVVMAPYLVLIP